MFKIILTFILLCIYSAFAAEEISEKNPEVQQISATILYGSKENNISFFEVEGDGRAEYAPLETTEADVQINYHNYSFGNSFKISDNDDSNYLNLFFSYNFKNHSADLYYQRNDGLYKKNENSIIVKDDSNRLSSINYGAQYYYAFNKDLEISRLTSFSKTPKDNGGSWILHSFLNRFSMSGNTTFLGQRTPERFNGTNLGAGGGYGHYWSSQKFYFSFLFVLGFGYQNKETIYNDITVQDNSLGSNMSVKLAMGGFFSKKYFYGFTLDVISNQYDQSDYQIQSDTMVNAFYFGRTF